MAEPVSGRIVVELRPRYTEALTRHVEATDAELTSLEDVALAIEALELVALLRQFGSPRSEPLISGHSLKEQVKRRRKVVLYNFFAIDVSSIPSDDDRRRLRRELRGLETIIASAEFEPTYTSAMGQPAPPVAGGGAEAAWQHAQYYLDVVGANDVSHPGAGAGLAIIEHGWYLEHECLRHLPNREDPMLAFTGSPYDRWHGTCALSVALAHPNYGKIRGIAHEARLRGIVMAGQRPWQQVYELVQNRLGYGDVLLFEISQSDGLPIEVFRATFVAIQMP